MKLTSAIAVILLAVAPNQIHAQASPEDLKAAVAHLRAEKASRDAKVPPNPLPASASGVRGMSSIDDIDFLPKALIAPSSLRDVFVRLVGKPRGAFESSDEYRGRMATLKRDTLYYIAEIPTTGTTACYYNALDYDADGERVQIALDIAESNLRLYCSRRSVGSYVGKNGFGVRKRISQWSVREHAIYTDIASWHSSVTYSVPMERASAKVIFGRLGLAVAFRPTQFGTGAFFSADDISTEPTMDSPSEEAGTRFSLASESAIVFLYDRVTRRIIDAHPLIDE